MTALHETHPDVFRELQSLRFHWHEAYDVLVSVDTTEQGERQLWTALRLDQSHGYKILAGQTAQELQKKIRDDYGELAEARRQAQEKAAEG